MALSEKPARVVQQRNAHPGIHNPKNPKSPHPDDTTARHAVTPRESANMGREEGHSVSRSIRDTKPESLASR